jgi:hypothetical protein
MKNKIILGGIAGFLLLVALALAADVNGKWTAQVQGMQGTSEMTFIFKADGSALTGTVANEQFGEAPFIEGKISGDDISFAVMRKLGDNEIKVLWKGKIAGDEIKFIREVQGGMMGGPGGGAPPGGAGGPGAGGPPPEIIAKRAK